MKPFVDELFGRAIDENGVLGDVLLDRSEGAAAPKKKFADARRKFCAACLPPVQRFSERGHTLTSLEVFPEGTQRGKVYKPKDLHDMARNFKMFSRVPTSDTHLPHVHVPMFQVPAVLGHEEEQEFLKREDLPAAGWGEDAEVISRPDAEGKPLNLLKMDFENIPDEVKKLLDSKAFRTVSAEIYDIIPEGLFASRAAMLDTLKSIGIDPAAAVAQAEAEAPAEKARRDADRARKLAAGTPEEALPPVGSVDDIVDELLRSLFGMMIRRVALLGANVPQCKGLKDIPPVETHSERARHSRSRRAQSYLPSCIRFTDCCPGAPGATWCFSEVTPMNHDEMIKQLTDMGFDADVAGSMSDEQLSEALRWSTADPDADVEPAPEPTVEPAPAANAEPELGPDGQPLPAVNDDSGTATPGSPPMPTDPTTSAPPTAYAEDDMPPADAAEMGDWIRRNAEKHGCKLHDDKVIGQATEGLVAASPTPKKITMTHQFTDAQLKTIATEVASQLGKKNDAALAQMKKFSETQAKLSADTLADQKKIGVVAFCEAHKDKIYAYQLDRDAPENLIDALLRADATTVVMKHGEKGHEVPLTEFDILKRRIAAGKVIPMGEKAKGSKVGVAGVVGDEVARAEAHYLSFAEDFAASDTTKDMFVNAFKARLARTPGLTLEQHLGKAAA